MEKVYYLDKSKNLTVIDTNTKHIHVNRQIFVFIRKIRMKMNRKLSKNHLLSA